MKEGPTGYSAWKEGAFYGTSESINHSKALGVRHTRTAACPPAACPTVGLQTTPLCMIIILYDDIVITTVLPRLADHDNVNAIMSLCMPHCTAW